MTLIRIRPLGRLAKMADWLMHPIMYWAAGTWEEAPQETHRWNNVRLSASEIATLNLALMAKVKGIRSAPPRIPILFHVARWRWCGWRNYVVLSTNQWGKAWHVGWRLRGGGGVSRIVLHGSVRMLVGRGDVEFFALDAVTGEQLPLFCVGKGRVGNGGPHAQLPLL